MPDIFYKFGWFHRDWMDIFLLHVTIDEILPFALPVLTILWMILLCAYILFRMRGIHRKATQRRNASEQKFIGTTSAFLWRKRLGLLLIVSVTLLTILSTSGLSMEHVANPPLIRVGQRAPDFALLSTKGHIESLKGATQHIVLLGFMPSVLCTFCLEQLQILQEASSELSTHGGIVYVISTDTSLLQQTLAQRLGLDYSMLSEAPTMNQHPAGSAYGIYHQEAAPVDTNAFIIIDAKGIVRALRITPDQPITGDEIRGLINSVLGPIGANHGHEYIPPIL